MGSVSSCTYKELVSDYASTLDHTQWTTKIVYSRDMALNFDVPTVPVALVESTTDTEIVEIPKFRSFEIEEMTMEPLLLTPKSYEPLMNIVSEYCSSPMLVSASTRGIKHTVFTIGNCLICTDGVSQSIYVPQRLVKMILKDCTSQGIDCGFEGDRTCNVYYKALLPQRLSAIAQSVMQDSHPREVNPMLTPVYADGCTHYVPANTSIVVCLTPSRRIEPLDGLQDTVLVREKRSIQILALSVSLP